MAAPGRRMIARAADERETRLSLIAELQNAEEATAKVDNSIHSGLTGAWPPATPPVEDLFDRLEREGEALQRERTNSSSKLPTWLRGLSSKRSQDSGGKTPRSKSSGKSSSHKSSSTTQLPQRTSPGLSMNARHVKDQVDNDIPPIPALPTAARVPRLKNMLSKVTMRSTIARSQAPEDVFAASTLPLEVSRPLGTPQTLPRSMPSRVGDLGRSRDSSRMNVLGRFARPQAETVPSPYVPVSPYRPQNASVHAISPGLTALPTMDSMPAMPTVPQLQFRDGLDSPTPLPRSQSHSSLYEAARRSSPRKISSVRQLREQASLHNMMPRAEPLGTTSPSGRYIHVGAQRMVAPPEREGWTYTTLPQLHTGLPHSDVADTDPQRWERGVAYARAEVARDKATERQRKKDAKKAAKREAAERASHHANALQRLVGFRRNEPAVRKTAELVQRGSVCGMALLKPIEELTEQDFEYVANNDEHTGMAHLFSGSRLVEDDDEELIDLDAAIVLDPDLTPSAGGGIAARQAQVELHGRGVSEDFNDSNDTLRRPEFLKMFDRPNERERFDWKPDYSQPDAQHGVFGPWMSQVNERFGLPKPEAAKQSSDMTNPARTANPPFGHTRSRHQVPVSTNSPTGAFEQHLIARRDSQDPNKFKLTPELGQQMEEMKEQREASSPSILEHPGIRAFGNTDSPESNTPMTANRLLQSKQALEYAAELPSSPFEDDSEGSLIDYFATMLNCDPPSKTNAGLIDKNRSNTETSVAKTLPRSGSPHANTLLDYTSVERTEMPQTPPQSTLRGATLVADRRPQSSSSSSALRPLILVERQLSREARQTSMSESKTFGTQDTGSPVEPHQYKVFPIKSEEPESPKSGIFIKAMSNAAGKRPAPPPPLDFSNMPRRYGKVRVEIKKSTDLSTGYKPDHGTDVTQKPRDGGRLVQKAPKPRHGKEEAQEPICEDVGRPSSDEDGPDPHLIEIIARLSEQRRTGRLNKEQKHSLVTKSRALLCTSPTRQELQDEEIFKLDQRLKYFDPQNRDKAIADRKSLSTDIDHVIADWEAAGPKLSSSEEARVVENLITEAQQLREEFGLPKLAAPLPGEAKHPLHSFEKNARKLMCRVKHNPAVVLPKLPVTQPGQDVHWPDFAQHLFEDVGPSKVGLPVKCGMPWCVDYCCEYGNLLARSRVQSNNVAVMAAAIEGKERLEALKAKCPNGVEDFETFMKCVGCGESICGRCITICGFPLCQEVCCYNCRDHKNNACPLHHPATF